MSSKIRVIFERDESVTFDTDVDSEAYPATYVEVVVDVDTDVSPVALIRAAVRTVMQAATFTDATINKVVR